MIREERSSFCLKALTTLIQVIRSEDRKTLSQSKKGWSGIDQGLPHYVGYVRKEQRDFSTFVEKITRSLKV